MATTPPYQELSIYTARCSRGFQLTLGITRSTEQTARRWLKILPVKTIANYRMKILFGFGLLDVLGSQRTMGLTTCPQRTAVDNLHAVSLADVHVRVYSPICPIWRYMPVV